MQALYMYSKQDTGPHTIYIYIYIYKILQFRHLYKQTGKGCIEISASEIWKRVGEALASLKSMANSLLTSRQLGL